MRKNFNLTDRTVSMISIFQQDKGFKSETAAIEAMIAIAYEKSFPKEKYEKKSIVADSVMAKTAEQICVVDLGGSLQETATGKTCKYFTYDFTERYEQEVPISMIDDSTPRGQYSPSRETVEELQEAGRVNY